MVGRFGAQVLKARGARDGPVPVDGAGVTAGDPPMTSNLVLALTIGAAVRLRDLPELSAT